MSSIFEKLIGPIRERARELGYAVGVHGSLTRDIDLIACPWTPEACDPRTLAQVINDVIAEHNDGTAFRIPIEDTPWFWAGSPGAKPHGRLTWNFYLGGPTYIDLSVMPRAADMTGEQIVAAATQKAEPMTGYVRGHKVFGDRNV